MGSKDRTLDNAPLIGHRVTINGRARTVDAVFRAATNSGENGCLCIVVGDYEGGFEVLRRTEDYDSLSWRGSHGVVMDIRQTGPDEWSGDAVVDWVAEDVPLSERQLSDLRTDVIETRVMNSFGDGQNEDMAAYGSAYFGPTVDSMSTAAMLDELGYSSVSAWLAEQLR